MKLGELLVECAVTLIQMTNDRKSYPEFRARKMGQRVEVHKPHCLEELVGNEHNAEGGEKRGHDLMVRLL